MNAPLRTFTPHKFTIDEVRAMARAGVLDGVEKMELIDGVLIEMPADGPRHRDYSYAIGDWLFHALGREYIKIPGSTLVLDKYNGPKPDWYVFPAVIATADVRGRDVLLAIEQSDSSLQRDLDEKAMLYARHGVRDYWAIDLEERRVHVHRDPAAEGYRTIFRVEAHEAVEALLVPELALRLTDLERV